MADEKDRAPAAVPASSAEPRAESASSADPRAEGLSSAEPRAESASSAAPHAVPASSAAARAGRPGVPKATNAHVRKSMQGNKGKDTKPELLVRRRLREAGLVGYRLQWKKAPGRPDVAWPGKKVALFVNGCFWHRCPHCQPRSPKTHSEYWQEKFRRNQERDRRNQELLELGGWHVHVVWECQLKKGVVDRTFAELLPRLAQELGREERYLVGESLEAQGAAVEAPAEAHEPQQEPRRPETGPGSPGSSPRRSRTR